MNLLLLILLTITMAYSAPIQDCPDQKIHGIIVEDEIPENKTYPDPEFFAPLIVEGQKGMVHLSGDNPDKDDGHVGYAPANCIKGRLMSLDHFKENYNYPENVEFRLMAEAQPIFGVKEEN